MADLVIRGMEMPKERNLWFCIKTDGTVYDIGTAHAVGTAIPIPEGHGKLIDTDKMRESIRRQTGLLKLMGVELAEIAETIEKGFLQEIDNAPTIIPAEGDGEDG